MSVLKSMQKYLCLLPVLALLSCSSADVPGARSLNIPAPALAEKRPEAINEKPDSVLYLPLGSDVLVPEVTSGVPLPKDFVGPFELRGETLAGALQLILADYDIPLAFETDEGLTRTITVANLRGPVDRVVDRVCGLADLYCSYEDGLLVVKETQTFAVTIPPVGGDADVLSAMSTGISAITGASPITESGTRTIIYEATNRTSKLAERYFQKLRSSTALIIFEVYIWEVALNTDNNLGIDWSELDLAGANISIPGSVGTTAATPVSIGLPTFSNGILSFDTSNILQFISDHGAVKTISQPQITVLSGAEATLRVADTENYVSSITRTVDNGEVSTSTETDSVDTGFTLSISSVWDNATVYGTIDIELQENQGITNFTTGEGTDAETTVQLPTTIERELSTQIRIRPGDSLLIAGLVRETDQFDRSGPGFDEPLFPTARATQVGNTELVFLLKPRVIAYTAEDTNQMSAVKAPTDIDIAPSVDPSEPLPAEEDVEITIDKLLSRREDNFPAGSLSPDLLNPSL